jgi:outer membrane protein OmpA-like peptidoglycan-associated protein
VRHGRIPARRITARGYGQAHPALPNDTAFRRARNRWLVIGVPT